MSNYRIPALLRLAKGQQCLLKHPQCCNFYPSTTVAAHSNQLRRGNGTGIKAHDFLTGVADIRIASILHREFIIG